VGRLSERGTTADEEVRRGVAVTQTRARRWFVLVAALAGASVLGACDDSSDPQTAATERTPVADASAATAASSTTAESAEPESATEVAQEFLDAYGSLDADRALGYLTDDAVASWQGYPGASWGSPELFRLELSVLDAHRVELIVTGCESQGEAADGTNVRCAFDLHLYGSNLIGRGPYGDNYWDFVVRDGQITSAAGTFPYFANGLSNEMWSPLQTWMTSTHPEDLRIMYPVGDPEDIEEFIRVWEERTREYAAAVKAGRAE
jgi:hypothetical protein